MPGPTTPHTTPSARPRRPVTSTAAEAVRPARFSRRTMIAVTAILVAVVIGVVGWGLRGDEASAAGPLPQDTRMGTVELLVNDLDAQRAFYGDVLGLEVIDEAQESVSLGAGGQPLVHLVRTTDPRPALTEAGLYHSALLYPDEAALSAVLMRVAEQAPESYQGASDHSVSLAFYLGDPEGNGVELYVDRDRSTWQWDGDRVQMGSAPLDPNAFMAQHQDGDTTGAPTMGHVHLKVGDLDEARRFYVDTLGFDVTSEADGAIFMSAGGYHHHLAANTWGSDGASARTATSGLGSVQVVLPTAADVDALAARLDDAGLTYEHDDLGLTVDDPWGTAVAVSAEAQSSTP